VQYPKVGIYKKNLFVDKLVNINILSGGIPQFGKMK
jgi:hypothetical protein